MNDEGLSCYGEFERSIRWDCCGHQEGMLNGNEHDDKVVSGIENVSCIGVV